MVQLSSLEWTRGRDVQEGGGRMAKEFAAGGKQGGWEEPVVHITPSCAGIKEVGG